MRGILRSGHLWASDVLRMNDPKQITYAFVNVIGTVALERENGFPKYIIQAVKSEAKVRELFGGWCTHVACLSAEVNLPNQWQTYADAGTGFAIGFNRASLSQTCLGLDMPLFPMCYSRPRQEEMIRSFLERANNIERDRNLRPSLQQEFQSQELVHLAALAMSIKDPAWQDEQEWRILVVQTDAQPRFTPSSRSDRVCFFKLPVCSSDTVREVVLGPCCALAEQELRQFLVELSMGNVCIRRSPCKF